MFQPCTIESCEKIGFTKVGNIGLDIVWSTNTNILDNVIKKYGILVNTRGSELYFDNNNLDFTNIGYNSNHDEIQIQNGKISNVSNGIQLFEVCNRLVLH